MWSLNLKALRRTKMSISDCKVNIIGNYNNSNNSCMKMKR